MKIVAAAAFAAFIATSAQGAVRLSDNFETENGGNSALNYTGFANFDVTGNVDLVSPPDYGISAPHSVVDLDGTTGPGKLTTKDTFIVGAGGTVTLQLYASGNQRDGNLDNFFAGFDFTNPTTVSSLSFDGSGFFDSLIPGTVGISNLTVLKNGGIPGSDDSFTRYSISFLADQTLGFKAFTGTDSRDNIGPVLKSFEVSVASVPEPATWAMLIAGFGMVGFAARRRRIAVTA